MRYRLFSFSFAFLHYGGMRVSNSDRVRNKKGIPFESLNHATDRNEDK